MRRMVVIAALLLCVSARADVVPPEPKDCPAGSQGRTCHGGPYCAAILCVDSSSCAGGTSCQTAEWCIEKLDCGGKGGSFFVDSVKGACPANAICKVGACQQVKVCLPKVALDARASDGRGSGSDGVPRTDGGVSSRGCSCALGEAGSSEGAPSWVLLVGALLVLGLRRQW